MQAIGGFSTAERPKTQLWFAAVAAYSFLDAPLELAEICDDFPSPSVELSGYF
jgi:hypothetical protein